MTFRKGISMEKYYVIKLKLKNDMTVYYGRYRKILSTDKKPDNETIKQYAYKSKVSAKRTMNVMCNYLKENNHKCKSHEILTIDTIETE